MGSARKSWRPIFALNVVLVAIFVGLIAGVHLPFPTAIQSGVKTQTPPATSNSSAIAGRASVIDGDTLDIHGKRIRFFGIDAPEGRQLCRDGQGRDYRCGQRAALALADKIGSQAVSCEQRDIDQYKRIVAVCRLSNEDLNRWIVREGWAVAYRHYSRDYIGAENDAKAARRGIWAGTFTQPEEWRRSKQPTR